MRFVWLSRVLAAAVLVLNPNPARSVTFVDGEHYEITAANSYPLGAVIVDDGPGGTKTTLRVSYDAQVGGLEIRGASMARINDGDFSGVVMAGGQSEIGIPGGTFNQIFQSVGIVPEDVDLLEK